tara:strand:+ start:34 stop:291 length:258 start_codon:yes stop_codon:yes gene_type:complete
MAEEKKSIQKQTKKKAAPKKAAPKKEVSISKSVKNKILCKHIRHHHLGNGEIIEELVVNNKDCYRIKFVNLTKTIVFKQEDIIKE